MAVRGFVVRLIPALEWLPEYDRRWLPRDVVAGLTTSAVTLPKAMAFAALAGIARAGRPLHGARADGDLRLPGVLSPAEREYHNDHRHPDGCGDRRRGAGRQPGPGVGRGVHAGRDGRLPARAGLGTAARVPSHFISDPCSQVSRPASASSSWSTRYRNCSTSTSTRAASSRTWSPSCGTALRHPSSPWPSPQARSRSWLRCRGCSHGQLHLGPRAHRFQGRHRRGDRRRPGAEAAGSPFPQGRLLREPAGDRAAQP